MLENNKNQKLIIKIKKFFNPEDEKRKIENIVLFIVILIVTVVAVKYIIGFKNNNDEVDNDRVLAKEKINNKIKNNNDEIVNDINGKNIYKDSLEEKLENVLIKISGVEDVSVMVTYSKSSETVPVYNENKKEGTTQESDTSGGTRTITEKENNKEVIYEEDNGQKKLVTQTIINPTIEGALIVVKANDDYNVKANIVSAVEALTGLATHKIQVLNM